LNTHVRKYHSGRNSDSVFIRDTQEQVLFDFEQETEAFSNFLADPASMTSPAKSTLKTGAASSTPKTINFAESNFVTPSNSTLLYGTKDQATRFSSVNDSPPLTDDEDGLVKHNNDNKQVPFFYLIIFKKIKLFFTF
jgi:hypothetical protein